MKQTTKTNRPSALRSITAANIANESFYNLVQLTKWTGYANPIDAMKALKTTWYVTDDANGNIIEMQDLVADPYP